MQGGADTVTFADGVNNSTVIDAETINGGSGTDTISTGGTSNVTITGGNGSDTLTLSSSGTHILRYIATTDSAVGDGDIITGFSTADADEDIWLDGFTSNAGSFSFLGTGAFTDTGNVQARMATNGLLEIDANGDGTADMEITLIGVDVGALDASDFTVT
jgi:hypothetical protein